MKKNTSSFKNAKQFPTKSPLVLLFLLSIFSLKGQYLDLRWEEDTFPSDSIPYIIEKTDPEYTSLQFDELKRRAVQGDINAYYQYYNFGHYGDVNCLSLSILMAEKYNYPHAFFNVYYILTEFYKNNQLPMDSSTINYAISFLNKGAELSDWNCCSELCKLYMTGELVAQDTVAAKSYLYKEYKDDEIKAERAWGIIKAVYWP